MKMYLSLAQHTRLYYLYFTTRFDYLSITILVSDTFLFHIDCRAAAGEGI